MAVYLITYDLNNETVRPKIVKDIKAYDNWACLSESSYAVVSDGTPEAVYNYLSKHLDGDDTLYVISLRRPYSGQGSKAVNDWLDTNLQW
ncbi:hypothetical protein [Thalassobaculum sp.]|uniref:hypothetical protein n=1 Tax=Thalassobaculum sp. TaxID=2022740 RepID=UPI0032EED908